VRPSSTGVLLLLLALPVALLALALGIGVGMLREGAAVLVSGLALVAVFGPAALPAALSPDRLAAYSAGLLGWSAVLILAFPTYFPAERAHALTAGLGALGQVVSAAPPPSLGPRLDALLPGDDGKPPAAPAEPAPPEPAPRPRPTREVVERVVSADPSDVVVLPYEGRGSSLKVPVDLEGEDGEVLEVMMLFDTGASFTSVDRATLDALGVDVPRDAPEVVVRTANGERSTPLVLIDRVWLGGLAIEGVTVGICDSCAHDDEVGLLGLNVSGRFLVTVDQETREIHLQPRASADRTADIRYWVEPSARATRWDDGRIEVEVSLANSAPRTVRDAVVRIDCGEAFTARFPPVAPGDEEEVRVGLPDGTDCAGYTVALESASW
jgi:hypothetical protein